MCLRSDTAEGHAVSLASACSITLPDWIDDFLAHWNRSLETPESRMTLAIALAAENVAQGTGGPFGAIVVNRKNPGLLAVGVNLVTELDLSIAHAEMIALSLAQAKTDHWNLGKDLDSELITSCEPCAMCFGAIPWSGVRNVICGARKIDAEAAGFDEGDKPPDWLACLEQRGINVTRDVLRDEAARVLMRYANTEGEIYQPGS
jgi:tRNA(Arg) A34 adenosine deaminase TadA